MLSIAVVTIVIGTASAALDSRMARLAGTLPPPSVAWGQVLSDAGSAGWMFAATGLVALLGLAARSLIPRSGEIMTRVIECASYLFATLCAESLAVQAVKHLVGRARPYEFGTVGAYHFDVLSMTDAVASFPSGHTANAFAMAVALSLMKPRYRVALFTLAGGIALSRIVVQAHYVSDILTGSIVGTLAALGTARVFARHGWAFALMPCRRLVLKGERGRPETLDDPLSPPGIGS